MMNHRDAWAEERRAPSESEWAQELARDHSTLESSSKTHSNLQKFENSKTVSAQSEIALPQTTEGKGHMDNQEKTEGTGGEVLVVASKLKAYIRGKSGMNTSGTVIDTLSNKVRALCDQAIENAKRDGRKTVMDRDFT